MAQIDWKAIADKHKLEPTERRIFFTSANTLVCALSGNITLMMAKNGDFLSLPVRQSFGEPQHVIRFQDIYQATNLKVQAALDEFIAEHKKWLRIG